MQELNLTPTKNTPEVKFNSGRLEMHGEAFPENASDFFRPLLDWLDNYKTSSYVREEGQGTVFVSNIDYFNTMSRPYVLEIVKKLNHLNQSGHSVKMKWFYEGELDIDEDDINFQELIDNFSIQIDYIPKTTR
jgi:hypothetical protein